MTQVVSRRHTVDVGLQIERSEEAAETPKAETTAEVDIAAAVRIEVGIEDLEDLYN